MKHVTLDEKARKRFEKLVLAKNKKKKKPAEREEEEEEEKEEVETLSRADLEECKKVTKLPPHFLSPWGAKDAWDPRFNKPTSVDLSMFENCTFISSGLLNACENLTHVNFLLDSKTREEKTTRAFEKVEVIQNDFLSQCKNLVEIDLSCFQRVRIVGNSFLHGSCSLVNLDLSSSFGLCEKIGKDFLREMKKLKSVNLNFPNLIEIGEGFLQLAESLTVLDISSFSNVEKVGSMFLAYAWKLKALNVSPLGEKCQCIGGYFLSGVDKVEIFGLERLNKKSLEIKDKKLRALIEEATAGSSSSDDDDDDDDDESEDGEKGELPLRRRR